ncbi:uncharacterized protein LOC142297117 [Anomaloglossus baeobatrachus]|uniref:uncharacterized protein LOC142297117 n=1 Tax=Anomaloglossus baeobatrachus TaxID=238106 RepID=UPI003F507BBF
MEENKNNLSRGIIEIALKIISVLGGEDYTIVEKTTGDCAALIIHFHVSGGRSSIERPITDAPHPPMPEKKILDLTREMTELLTGEVPIRCQDVAIYFSMEEWEYMEGQKDQYQDVRRKNDPIRVDEDKSNMAARIWLLTLEMIDLLKGKEQMVVKTTSGECVTPHLCGGRSEIQSRNTEAPHSPTPEKILHLTNKITELLTGEVPLRCQDVAVYFSMEEWDYLEGHRDLYSDVVVEERRLSISPVQTMEFSRSQKKNNVMIYLGFEYLAFRTINAVLTWRCRPHHSSKCHSILKTKDDNVVQEPTERCRDSCPQKAEANVARSKMREDMRAISATARNVMGKVLSVLSNDVLAHMPRQSSEAWSIIQQMVICLTQKLHFCILEKYSQLIRHDSGKADRNRILILGDRSHA